MKSISGAIFSVAIALLIFESHVNSVIITNSTLVRDEFGFSPSLIYDGGSIVISCWSKWATELVVNHTFTRVAKATRLYWRMLDFSLEISNKSVLGSYHCKDHGWEGNVSAEKVDIFYRICDTCTACLQPDCGKNFMFSYFNMENQEKCTSLDQIYAGNIIDIDGYKDWLDTDDAICVTGEKTPQKSLFDAFKKKRALSCIISMANQGSSYPIIPSPEERENVCVNYNFQLTKDTKELSMGSAILYNKDTYLTIVCNSTIARGCNEYQINEDTKGCSEYPIKDDMVGYADKVICGKPFKMTPFLWIPRIARSMVTFLVCNGKTTKVNGSVIKHGVSEIAETYFDVKTFIYLVYMDTAHYFTKSQVPLEGEPKKMKLHCGFIKPPIDKRFTITANLWLNGKLMESKFDKDAEFVAEENDDYECQLIMHFKSCYMQAEFTLNVTSKLSKYQVSDSNQTSKHVINYFFVAILTILVFGVKCL